MPRRRRHQDGIVGLKGDPARDLFAYLFLIIMVFCFMLSITRHEMIYNLLDGDAGQAPAKSETTPGTALIRMDESDLGRLVRKGGEIFIAYGNRLYSPGDDLESLRADGRIKRIAGKDDSEKMVLYLEDSPDQQVMLTEYLQAFAHLSRYGYGVAFAERVNE